jgi:hypothetical protein
MEYVIEPGELVNGILSDISEANLDWAKSALWTKAIKQSLYRLLHKDLTEVIFTNSSENAHEFLLDLIAWDRDDGEGIVLGMECEWLITPTEIVSDFEKLLVIKAPLKLMMFASSGTSRSQEQILKALDESLQRYKQHVQGERYIFVDFARAPHRLAYWIQIPSTHNGRLKELPQRNLITTD